MPQNLEIINDTIKENHKKNLQTWIYITDIRSLVCETGQNRYLHDLIKQADSSDAILTFMAGKWEDIPKEIVEHCQYIQLFAPGFKQDVDRHFYKHFDVTDQTVSCVEDYIRKTGDKRGICG